MSNIVSSHDKPSHTGVWHDKCVICGSLEVVPFLELKDHSISKEDFEIYNCRVCGQKFTQNAPVEDQIGRYYQSEAYISHSDTREGLINKVYHIARNVMLSMKYSMIKQLGNKSRLLDVGSGSGYFLNYMKGKGFEVKGVEMDDSTRDQSIGRFSLDVFASSGLFDGTLDGKFDFITLWHVLEHLYDPDKYVQRFSELLEDDGYLLIAIPNLDSYDAQYFESYWAAYDVPRHLWHWSPKVFKRFAEKNNFEVMYSRILPLDGFYNSMLSEQYKGRSMAWLRGAVTGSIALARALLNKEKGSSMVYVLRKKLR